MNPKLDSNNLKTIIRKVCFDCWTEASKATQIDKYWEVKYTTSFSVSTYRKSICDWCKKEESVTQTRDFFYPNFNLLNIG